MDTIKIVEATEEDFKAAPALQLKETATRVVKVGDIYKLEFNTKDALVLQLRIYSLLNIAPNMKEELLRDLNILESTVKSIKLKRLKGKGFNVEYTLKAPLADQERAKLDQAIGGSYIQVAIATLLGITLEDIEKESNKDKYKQINKALEEGTHKQPNGLLKTIAAHTGRDIATPNLFNVDLDIMKNPEREAISRKAGQVLMYLIKLYQEKGEDTVKIDNLTKVAKEAGLSSAQELKNIMDILGGVLLPIGYVGREGTLTLTKLQLLDVCFVYSKEVVDKYKDKLPTRGYLESIIKNEKVDYITFKPNKIITDGLNPNPKQRNIGYSIINNAFLLDVREFSFYAHNIINFFISNNTRTQKIAEDKLLPHIGIDKATVYKEGIKRIREKIHKALQELQDKGYLESYGYDLERSIYTLTLTDKAKPKIKKS